MNRKEFRSFERKNKTSFGSAGGSVGGPAGGSAGGKGGNKVLDAIAKGATATAVEEDNERKD